MSGGGEGKLEARSKDTERQEQREETYLNSEDTVAQTEGWRVKPLENTCQKGFNEVIKIAQNAVYGKNVSISL